MDRVASSRQPYVGVFDKKSYNHYGNPLNGDLHEIVPWRIIAFKGPKDLNRLSYTDGDRGLGHSPQSLSPHCFTTWTSSQSSDSTYIEY